MAVGKVRPAATVSQVPVVLRARRSPCRVIGTGAWLDYWSNSRAHRAPPADRRRAVKLLPHPFAWIVLTRTQLETGNGSGNKVLLPNRRLSRRRSRVERRAV